VITTIPAEPRSVPIEIELPWPPSVNRYWRSVGAKTLISKEGRHYREFAEGFAWEQDRRAWPLKGRLRVVVTAFPPDRRRRDLDNILKSLLDTLEHIGLYEDDSQIDRLEVTRAASLGGLVYVTVEEVG
jgi:crossover junction endodeoxyribonuclease RusA